MSDVAESAPISAMPCPFCGSTFAQKVNAISGKPPNARLAFRLQCPCCDAQTGIGGTNEIIKGYWERRPVALYVPRALTKYEQCAKHQGFPITLKSGGPLIARVVCPNCEEDERRQPAQPAVEVALELRRRCSCGYPDASCTRQQTDCVKWKP